MRRLVSEKEYGLDSPLLTIVIERLASIYLARKDYAKAEPLLKRSLAIWEKDVEPNHHSVEKVLNRLAQLYYNQGDYAKSEPPLKRCLAIQEKVLGPDDPRVTRSLENLAKIYRNTDRIEDAQNLEKKLHAQGLSSERTRLLHGRRKPYHKVSLCMKAMKPEWISPAQNGITMIHLSFCR